MSNKLSELNANSQVQASDLMYLVQENEDNELEGRKILAKDAIGQEIPYATWQNMTAEQKEAAGKVFVPDFPNATPNATEIPMSSSDNTSVSSEISRLGALSQFTATGSVYGSFSCKAINGVKCISVNNPKGLAANALTTLDFTLPETMRPVENIRYFDIRQPSDNYTIRLIINPDGTVQIYNYGTATGTLNMSFTGCYI